MSLIIPPHEQKKLQSAQNRQAFFRIGLAFFVLGIPCQRLDGCSVSYFQTKINALIYERVLIASCCAVTDFADTNCSEAAG